MKLSQNYENRQTQQKREYEQFRRQILRHGAAFGVVYGTATGLGQDSPFEHVSGEFETGSARSSVSPGTITAIVGRVETAAAGLQSSFNNIISGFSARRE